MNILRKLSDKFFEWDEKLYLRLEREEQDELRHQDNLWLMELDRTCEHSPFPIGAEMPVVRKFAIHQSYGKWIHLNLRVCLDCGIPYWEVEEVLEPMDPFASHIISAQQATLLLSAELCAKARPIVESHRAGMLAFEKEVKKNQKKENKMAGIIKSLWCLPCVWSALALVAVVVSTSYFTNKWLPFMGILPIQGPEGGFLSMTDKEEFFDTKPVRIRAAAKAGVIIAVIWVVGLVMLFLILR